MHARRHRPELVALVDAFEFSDWQLNNSAIGSFDGNVYERLVASTEQEPLNNQPGGGVVGYEEFLAPIMRGRAPAHVAKL